VEALFLKKVGVVPVVGYIDLIEKVGPEIPSESAPFRRVVVDTKTGKQAWSQDDLDRDPQFTLYSLVTGIPDVRVDSLAFLKAGPSYSFKTGSRNAHSQRVLVEDYEETVDLIKRGIFPKAPIDSWACAEKWCPHWNRCRGNPDNYG
jgi:RecB family exonuclease